MSMDAYEGGKGKQAVMACPFRLELKDVMMDLGLRPRDDDQERPSLSCISPSRQILMSALLTHLGGVA